MGRFARICEGYHTCAVLLAPRVSRVGDGGRNAGAIGNLYLGYNFLATRTVVIGGQVEGGISNIRVNLAGTGSSTTNSTSL
jgi:hypothetical protein